MQNFIEVVMIFPRDRQASRCVANKNVRGNGVRGRKKTFVKQNFDVSKTEHMLAFKKKKGAGKEAQASVVFLAILDQICVRERMRYCEGLIDAGILPCSEVVLGNNKMWLCYNGTVII